MKVFMINTVCGIGSTGRICTDIASYLLNNGDECIIAYGQGTTNYPYAYKIGSVIENHIHNLCSRTLGLQGYFSTHGTKKLIEKIIEEKPDIIHLHNLHGNYLNVNLLFEYLKTFQGKIFWTLHDCLAFTGKCSHYTDALCEKWKTECYNCPQVHTYPPSILLDRSKKIFTDKKKNIEGIKNITVITVSDWLKIEVEQSMLSKFMVKRVYNWIDYRTFNYQKTNLKRELNISEEKKIVLCVSAYWNKIDHKYTDLMKLADILPSNYVLIVVGKNTVNFNKKNIFHLPYISSKENMAEIYSLADVYVHLSTEDTFGLVIAEAMACGTPAIVYNSTACPEIVGSKKCGEIVENFDQVKEKIVEIVERGKTNYSENCRNRVLQNFDIDKNINDILNLYRS